MSNNDEMGVPGDPTAQSRRLPGLERHLGVSPLDIRQAKFGTAIRGFERNQVMSFLREAADGYERSLHENDRLRQEIAGLEASLQQFRQFEGGLRTMLVSAQRVVDDMRESAQQEAERLVREAEERVEFMLQSAQAQTEDIQRDIDGLKLKRRSAENALQSMVVSLQSALEFIRELDDLECDLEFVTPHQRLEAASA